MKLTTKGRYAVTAMVDVVMHGQTEAPVSLVDISRRQDISLSYLEQLFAQLRRAGLVDSVRGPGGGYRVARPIGEIAIAEIIEAVKEDVDATRCGGAENCHGDTRCLTHVLWQGLSDHIQNYLQGITLETLAQDKGVIEVAERQSGIELNSGTNKPEFPLIQVQ